MINYAKLAGYRKGIRPVQPESLPAFLDRELDRIALVIGDIVAAIQNIEERLDTLETP